MGECEIKQAKGKKEGNVRGREVERKGERDGITWMEEREWEQERGVE